MDTEADFSFFGEGVRRVTIRRFSQKLEIDVTIGCKGEANVSKGGICHLFFSMTIHRATGRFANQQVS